jgi:hypothetical protein
MHEEKKEPSLGVAQRNVGHRFPPHHERFGGRKKRTAMQARELACQLGVDPLEYMLNLLTKDVVEEVEIDAKGKERKVKVPIGHELKIDICKTLANFFYPRLSATQVTGKDDGPLQVAALDLTTIMADPRLSAAAQEIAMLVAEQQARALPAGALADHPDYER